MEDVQTSSCDMTLYKWDVTDISVKQQTATDTPTGQALGRKYDAIIKVFCHFKLCRTFF